MEHPFTIPLTVPKDKYVDFIYNYKLITQETGHLFVFSGDQKIEHLNDDFYGSTIDIDDASPEHLFNIAKNGRVGAFASQLGLIARYGAKYPTIPYIIKMNSKTNLLFTKQADPISLALYDIADIIAFKKESNLSIVGVGYTIYLGSEHESTMLREASRIILEAHKEGLITILWMYPRGKAVTNERDAHIIAGASGVAACLGADFAKINLPDAPTSRESATLLAEARNAAGNTQLICSGGASIDSAQYLKQLYEQVTIGKINGCAVGRNIHQKKHVDAVALCNAIAAIVIDRTNLEEALKFL